MKHLLARWLGLNQRLESYEQRCQQLVAQRDANREGWEMTAQAADIHARQKQDLAELLDLRSGIQQEAAELVRSAHRQLNLNGGTRRAQQQILQAARLLEGDN